MRRNVWLLALSAAALFGGCAPDRLTGGSEKPRPTAEQRAASGAVMREIASGIGGYLHHERVRLANGSPEERGPLAALDGTVAALREEAARAEAEATGTVGVDGGVRSDVTTTDDWPRFVDDGTFTDVDMWLGDVSAFSRSNNWPVTITHTISGTVTIPDHQYPISNAQSTSPFVTIAFYSHVILNEVDCFYHAASVDVATEHMGG
jgi:hypothetical protein